MLGKEVVFAHDTPNFIANRIGIAVMFNAANLMLEQGLTIEEVDALTGHGHRLAAHRNLSPGRSGGHRYSGACGRELSRGRDGGKVFRRVLEETVKRGWLGDKAGQGFYKKVRGARRQGRAPGARSCELRVSARRRKPRCRRSKWRRMPRRCRSGCRLLLENDPAKDKAAAFLWPFLASLWNFAAERIGEVADDAASIDAAMRAGFNWELGPFEMWDAAGVAQTVERMKASRSAGERAR